MVQYLTHATPQQEKRAISLLNYTNSRKYHIPFWSVAFRMSTSRIHSIKPVAYYENGVLCAQLCLVIMAKHRYYA